MCTGPMELSGVSSSTFSMTDFAGSGGGARMSVGPGMVQKSQPTTNFVFVGQSEDGAHIPEHLSSETGA